ncbi:class II aldolase/adducin family protein [Hoeflea prorocentri]|uniref:Class II aldolase/adducin family protein n=1 Tax=Hoeflea prorocentri TaxID=1922333 RepID=A0A9X3UIR6_9HYPH|nr:class II aldolase/adducin family protein [Hoeflea prorocentri]MCY6381565.1 class II aldolase/adducin family protein [Hoeflea prorocentri]MDA5399365.1 class II aldolase/adducin family protein [Hoeflea prorocentri]
MKSLWRDDEANGIRSKAGPDAADKAVAERVYTSRLLGSEPDLVLHGGGNTSVKVERQWPDGTRRRTLHVKGSGWDLATIEAPGLPAVDLAPLIEARYSGGMSDPQMVALLRASLLDGNAPNPSVETLLHAFIPKRFVDHTHSLPILVLANQPDAEAICNALFGDEVAYVPYVMPGFDLSIAAADIVDKSPGCKGLFLKNHGLFTFSDDAEEAYRLTIEYTTRAEDHLAERSAVLPAPMPNAGGEDDDFTERLKLALAEVFADLPEFKTDYRNDVNIRVYTSSDDLDDLSRRGTVTPDHVIRIKPFPLICEHDDTVDVLKSRMEAFARDYEAYFNRHAASAAEPKTMLSSAPKAVLIRHGGLYGVDTSEKGAAIVADLMVQTARAVMASERYGRFQPIAEDDLFDMEYWTLEQAKLMKSQSAA